MDENVAKASLSLPTFPDEDEDVCRVCRVEGDDEMPLIYPCKCSGSVRYVHSECLKHWLAASQKKHCEICGHKYTFTKVYSELPSQIPLIAYCRQAIRFAVRSTLKVLRFCLVSNTWLILLPAMNMFSLRTILWLADICTPRRYALIVRYWTESKTSKPIETLLQNSTGSNGSITNNTIGNATEALANLTTASIANMTSMTIDDLLTRPFAVIHALLEQSWSKWSGGESNTLFGFIFRGQALSVALAGAIVGLILMREWMAQHNWAEHLPRPPREHEPINIREWRIDRGVAYPVEAASTTIDEGSEEIIRRKKELRRIIKATYAEGRVGEDSDLGLEASQSSDRAKERQMSFNSSSAEAGSMLDQAENPNPTGTEVAKERPEGARGRQLSFSSSSAEAGSMVDHAEILKGTGVVAATVARSGETSQTVGASAAKSEPDQVAQDDRQVDRARAYLASIKRIRAELIDFAPLDSEDRGSAVEDSMPNKESVKRAATATAESDGPQSAGPSTLAAPISVESDTVDGPKEGIEQLREVLAALDAEAGSRSDSAAGADTSAIDEVVKSDDVDRVPATANATSDLNDARARDQEEEEQRVMTLRGGIRDIDGNILSVFDPLESDSSADDTGSSVLGSSRMGSESGRSPPHPKTLDRVPDLAFVAPELVQARAQDKGKRKQLEAMSTVELADHIGNLRRDNEIMRRMIEETEVKNQALTDALNEPDSRLRHAIMRQALDEAEPLAIEKDLGRPLIPLFQSDDDDDDDDEGGDDRSNAVENENEAVDQWVDEESDNDPGPSRRRQKATGTRTEAGAVAIVARGDGTGHPLDPVIFENEPDMQEILRALNAVRPDRWPIDPDRPRGVGRHGHGRERGRFQDPQPEERERERERGQRQGQIVLPAQIDPADPLAAMRIPLELEEEEDMGFDGEEWNGVLEVMGLIGPLSNLLQNFFFGLVISGAAQLLLIGIPIWLGRVMISLDLLHSFAYTIELVLRGIRLIIEPIKDITLEIGKEVILLPVLSSLKAFDRIVTASIGIEPISSLFAEIRSGLSPKTDSTVMAVAVHKTGDVFAMIGRYSLKLFHLFASSKVTEQATGMDSTMVTKGSKLGTELSDRLLHMLVGYLTAGTSLAVAAIAAEAGVIFLHTKDALVQQVLFIKLAIFMVIELGVFPIIIGYTIRICTLPLFGPADVLAALAGWKAAPAGSTFIAWFVGTLFMLGFANILTHIRKICRPGALFFIRDPVDQTYNPVKEIMQRPTINQARKLLYSLMMYTFVIFCLFGVTCWTLVLWPFAPLGVLPLRLDKFPPLTSIPFDLLFINAFIPPTFEAIRAKQKGKRLLGTWWRAASAFYKLTPLLYGRKISSTRKPDSALSTLIWRILDIPFQMMFGAYDPSETQVRVPASDRTILLPIAERQGPNNGVFIRLDATGKPRTLDETLRLLKQDRAAREGGRDPIADYQVVWVPRFWRTRVYVMILSALASCSAVLAVGFFGTLVVGRLCTAWAFGNGVGDGRVHDGYSLLAGFYLVWSTAILGYAARKKTITLRRAARLRQSNGSTRIKRRILALLSGAYTLGIVGLVLPLLIGLIWELYIAVPGRYGMRREGAAVIHIWDAWSMGVAFCSLFIGMAESVLRCEVHRDTPATWAERIFDCINKPLRIDIREFHSSIWPALVACFGAVVIPGLSGLLWSLGCEVLGVGGRLALTPLMHRMIYPSTLLILLPILARRAILKRWSKVRQRVIDAEYVVEERVENYGEEGGDKVLLPGGQVGEVHPAREVEIDLDEIDRIDRDGDEEEIWEDVDVDEGRRDEEESDGDGVAEVFRTGMYA